MEKFKQILLHRHKTIASLAHALQISKSVVHRRGQRRYYTPSFKCYQTAMTDQTSESRLQFCFINDSRTTESGNKMARSRTLDTALIMTTWELKSQFCHQICLFR
ncbi:hypothetical protein Leryth_016813 [Lithospermum erythrorhizon]|nr:hypothetical protein Leryth_016813 [Lithospermum erythrorhizon]